MKAQSSLEFLMIIGITFAVLIPTAYLFYVSGGSDDIGVIRLINNVWDGQWSSTNVCNVDNAYRMIAKVETIDASTVELSLAILDLENSSYVVFNQTFTFNLTFGFQLKCTQTNMGNIFWIYYQ